MTKRQVTHSNKMLGSLGVVYGDIGTSPLYALPAAFMLGHFSVTRSSILGVVSMIIWVITIIIALKYVTIMLRADNNGEGGIMALVALLRRFSGRVGRVGVKRWAFIGLIGVALFYGDSVITPAISVLSAIEGTSVALPSLATWTVPVVLGVLTVLFFVQSHGTERLGRRFGPIMLVWFVVSGSAGLLAVMHSPDILWALSPLTAVRFIIHNPASAFAALGAVVLSVTGAEALYADMGHFGGESVRKSWFTVVYPALLATYLGQGAVLLSNHSLVSNIYFHLFPAWAQLAAVGLATIATLIASQSVIVGAFSLTRQAVQLGYLPRLRIVHTSNESGQIYIAGVNWFMYIVVALLVIIFGSSARLSNAYGMAESGTLLASTMLLMVVVRYIWPRIRWLIYSFGVIFFMIEGSFVIACTTKIVHGAWIPLAIAAAVLIVLTTWARGSDLIAEERHRREGKLSNFVGELPMLHGLVRSSGVAVYIAHHTGYVPLALRATVDRLHELSEVVIIVAVESEDIPRVPLASRAEVSELGRVEDGIVQIILHFGFDEVPNVPLALEHAQRLLPRLQKLDLHTATYFISEADVAVQAHHRHMNYIRTQLFTGLYRISAPSPVYFRLPPGHTIDMASYVEL